MEITEINMISDFEAGMKCLQNPSLISRFFSFPGIEKVPQVYSFWKWGALIFAIFATFSSIIKRFKLFLIRFHTVKPVFPPQYEQVTDFSEDDDISLASSSDDDREEEEEGGGSSATTSFRGRNRDDGDFSVKGSSLCFRNQWQSGHLRQRRRRSFTGCWSEFTSSKNVVKLWDSLGLSLDFDEDLINSDSGSVVSMWDFDHDQKRSDFPGGVWTVASPAVVMTADGNGKGNGVVLGGYDARMRPRVPALFAEWSSPATAVDGMAVGSGGKVYVRNDDNGVVTVGDVRNMKMALENVRDSNGDTWWDADAVIVGEEFEDSS